MVTIITTTTTFKSGGVNSEKPLLRMHHKNPEIHFIQNKPISTTSCHYLTPSASEASKQLHNMKDGAFEGMKTGAKWGAGIGIFVGPGIFTSTGIGATIGGVLGGIKGFFKN